MNDQLVHTSLQLKNQDHITAFCSILPDQSISDAFQFVCRKASYHSSGVYSILQSLHENQDGVCSFQTLQTLSFSNRNLNDLDLYTFLLPFRSSFLNLQSIFLDSNCFTDIAAEMLSVWLSKEACPRLQVISIGKNLWHGKGLDALLFALRSYNIHHLVNDPVLFDPIGC